MPIVNADAGSQPNDSTVDEETSSESATDDESLSDDQRVKKKQKREKVGFRDRKVYFCYLFRTHHKIIIYATMIEKLVVDKFIFSCFIFNLLSIFFII